jgi:hypothetical protein
MDDPYAVRHQFRARIENPGLAEDGGSDSRREVAQDSGAELILK